MNFDNSTQSRPFPFPLVKAKRNQKDTLNIYAKMTKMVKIPNKSPHIHKTLIPNTHNL